MYKQILVHDHDYHEAIEIPLANIWTHEQLKHSLS